MSKIGFFLFGYPTRWVSSFDLATVGKYFLIQIVYDSRRARAFPLDWPKENFLNHMTRESIFGPGFDPSHPKVVQQKTQLCKIIQYYM